MVFVFSKEGAMGTKSLSVSQADDFKLLVVQRAFLYFHLPLSRRLTYFFGGFLWLTGDAGGFLFPDGLGEGDIFREVLEICLCDALSLSAVPTLKGGDGLGVYYFFEAGGAGTMLAGGHHARLAVD